MSSKGYSSQTKLDRLSAEFATIEPVRVEQNGVSVNAHMYVYVVGTDAVEASSTIEIINATGHVAQKGDVIRFTSGALDGTEVKVWSVAANTIELAEDLPSAPAAAVTFQILRHKYPVVAADGSIAVSVAPSPIIFTLDGVDQEVTEDTVTPANNAPLPVKLMAGTSNIGDVDVVSSVLPTGAATEATLASIDSLLTHGQQLAASSIPVVIASDQPPVDVSGTVAVSGTVDVTATDLDIRDLTSASDSVASVQSGTWTVGLSAGSNNIGDVDVLSLPSIPAGTNNIGDVDVLTLPSIPNGNNVIGFVKPVLLTPVDFIDTTPVLDTSSTNIPASASTPLTIVASLDADISKIQFLDTTGEFIGLYLDPAGTPVLLAIFGPGSDQTLEVEVAATTAIGIRNMANTVISSGKVAVNFLG